ncbi:hypothetical protein [Streptomyces sp. NPDC093984]|uniref:hypothetical protein n=1 Tax=Streptomyces sp. NPDC093984 TaxID=3366052 RepID=UPI00380875E8
MGGVAYLVYVDARVPRAPIEPVAAEISSTVAACPRHFLVRGIGVSALYPKGPADLPVAPPVVHQALRKPTQPLQLAALGGVYVVTRPLAHVPLGYAADRALSARPGAARATAKVAGAAMILVAGLALLAERVLQGF